MPIVVEIFPVICDLAYNWDAYKWAFTLPSRIPAIRVRVGIVLSELFFRPWNVFVKRFPGTQVVFGEPQFCPSDTRCACPRNENSFQVRDVANPRTTLVALCCTRALRFGFG